MRSVRALKSALAAAVLALGAAARAHAGYQAILAASSHLILVYPAAWDGDAVKRKEVGDVADFYRAHGVAAVDVESDVEASSAAVPDGTLFLIGSPLSNTLVRRVEGSLPADFDRGGFSFEGKHYGRAAGLLLALPSAPPFKHPVLLHLGATYEGAMAVFSAPAGDWDFLIASQDRVERRGFFTFSPDGDVIGPAEDEDFGAVREDYARRALTKVTPHFIFHYLPGSRAAADIDKLAALNETLYTDLAKAFGLRGLDKPIGYTLYESTGQKAIITGLDANAHSDLKTLSVYAVYAEGLNAVGYHELAHLFARTAWGEPGTKLMGEGLAVYFDGQWWDHPLGYWGGRLQQEGRVPSLDTLAHDAAYWNAHDADCYALAGDFVLYLSKNHTMKTLRALYLSGFTAADIQTLLREPWASFEKDWDKELAAQAKRAAPDAEKPAP